MLVRDKKNPSLLDPFIRFAKNEVFEYAPWSLSNETFGVNLPTSIIAKKFPTLFRKNFHKESI
jgi:hypothetical protein